MIMIHHKIIAYQKQSTYEDVLQFHVDYFHTRAKLEVDIAAKNNCETQDCF